MILLDTDHFSVFTDERDARHDLLNARMEAATQPIACTIVSVEEVITLVHDARLLTTNSRDVSQVPGLRHENWLQP
ncbi:MAG: hypothetical protein L0Y71_08235 [Gemmataceae bacterium]|nr:hypothetical protein [Gemmataceae bacterium]